MIRQTDRGWLIALWIHFAVTHQQRAWWSQRWVNTRGLFEDAQLASQIVEMEQKETFNTTWIQTKLTASVIKTEIT